MFLKSKHSLGHQLYLESICIEVTDRFYLLPLSCPNNFIKYMKQASTFYIHTYVMISNSVIHDEVSQLVVADPARQREDLGLCLPVELRLELLMLTQSFIERKNLS